MSIALGIGVVALLATGYIGRKGWLAFHRAVGITPGKLTYTDPAELPPPPLIQLQIDEDVLQELPPVIIQRLSQIDTKADIYHAWQQEAVQSGQAPIASEDEFVVSKMLGTRLPEILAHYQRISQHKMRLEQVSQTSEHQHGNGAQQQLNQQETNDLADSTVISKMLIKLLDQIDAKLDSLLLECQNHSLHEMQVMRRYLEDR